MNEPSDAWVCDVFFFIRDHVLIYRTQLVH